MADQIERVTLQAEDRTAAPTASANKNIASVEAQSAKTSAAITGTVAAAGNAAIVVTDKSKKQIDRIVDNVERRVNALKSPLERLTAQRDVSLGKVAGDPAAVDRVTSAFSKLISEEQKHNAAAKAIADAIRNPLNAAGNAVESFGAKFGTIGIIGVAVAAGVAVVGKELFNIVAAAGKAAEQTSNLADRLGVTTDQAQDLEAMARIAGVSVDSLTGLERKLSQTLADGGPAGDSAVRRLESLGINVVKAGGGFRDSIDILRDFSTQINKFPDHATKVKLLNDVFGRGAIELLPLIEHFGELEKRAQSLGNRLKEDTIKRLAAVDDQLDEMGISFDRLKLKFADALVISVKFVNGKGQALDSVVDDFAEQLANFTGVGHDPTRPKGPAISIRTSPTVPEGALTDSATNRGNAIVNQFRNRVSDSNLQRQLAVLESQQNEAGAKIQTGLTDAAAKTAIANFDAISKRVEAIKAQIKELAEIPAAVKAAHALLLDAQAAELNGIGKVIVERRKALEEYGKTAGARADIEKAFTIKFAIEQNKIRLENKKLAADIIKTAQEQADKELKIRAQLSQQTHDLIAATEEVHGQTDLQAAGQGKDAQLRQLELINAQTISAKIAVENRKAQIETQFEQRSEQLQEAALGRETDKQLAQLKAEAAADFQLNKFSTDSAADQLDAKLANDVAYQTAKIALETNTEAKLQQIRQASDAAQNAAREQAAIKSAQIIQQYNQETFDTFKRQAEGVIDATFQKGENVFKAIGNSLKTSVLTAIKDVVSSRIAAELTQLVTGTKVTLVNQTPGAGPLGKLAGVFGLGAKPVFGQKLEAPGHLGDVQLQSGAVPVLITNPIPTAGSQPAASAASGGLFGLAGLGALAGVLGSKSTGGPGSAVTSSIDFGTGNIPLGGTITGGQVGTNSLPIGGTPPFLPSQGGATGQAGGILGPLKGLGNIGSTFSAAHGGVNGAAGGALLAGGGILAVDGLRRGGVTGLLETTAGGAAIGAKFGGPLGALIGAGVGAIAGTIRLFIKGKDEKIVKRVKEIYGIDIAKSFAKDPLQKIIDANYGGDIEVGLRSPDVVDQINLYARSHGQGDKTQLANKPYAVGLQISGGQLQQTAAKEDGTAIAYGGGTAAIAGGVNRLITGQTAPAAGQPVTLTVSNLQLNMNGDSVNKALSGAIVNNPEAVSTATLAANNLSMNRRQNQIAQTTPGLLLQ